LGANIVGQKSGQKQPNNSLLWASLGLLSGLEKNSFYLVYQGLWFFNEALSDPYPDLSWKTNGHEFLKCKGAAPTGL
jgi:hypothetical protein